MTAAIDRWGFLRWPSFLAALTTLILSGWVHGLWTGRWQPEDKLRDAVARVDQVPMKIGEDWVAESQETDPAEFAQAGALGYWARRYTHTRTKDSVLVILMCGRAGKMSVHTPEICYQGAGFAIAGAPELCKLKWLEFSTEGSATLWTAQFRKDGASAPVRLFWGWNGRGDWQALSKPRWETQGEPFLYKMYISLNGTPVDSRRPTEAAASDMRRGQEFLDEFLPVLQQTLFPRPEASVSR